MGGIADGIERCATGAIVRDGIDQAVPFASGGGLSVDDAVEDLALEFVELSQIDTGWGSSVLARRGFPLCGALRRAGGGSRRGRCLVNLRRVPHACIGRNERSRG